MTPPSPTPNTHPCTHAHMHAHRNTTTIELLWENTKLCQIYDQILVNSLRIIDGSIDIETLLRCSPLADVQFPPEGHGDSQNSLIWSVPVQFQHKISSRSSGWDIRCNRSLSQSVGLLHSKFVLCFYNGSSYYFGVSILLLLSLFFK